MTEAARSALDRPRVWVTRARPGADRTAERLTQLGFEAVVQPLLALDPDFPAPDLQAAVEAAGAIAFTSVNGVRAFARLTDRRDRRVFAVGDRTAQVARAAGFGDVVSADGDARTLAERIVADPPSPTGPILVPGAAQPAVDLVALLAGRVRAVALPVYRTLEVPGEPPQALHAVVVHSPRAATILARRLSPEAARDLLAVTLSAAVAAPLSALPFATARIAARPREDDLIAALGNPPDPV